WVIYSTFLLITLGLAIFSIIQSKIKSLSIIAIVIICTTPVIGIINSIERENGINEFEHLVIHLRQGSLWAFYIIISHLYILVWWILFFSKDQVTKRSG
ncbi:hypothetical protein, partial [Bacillus sp. JJ722]|uniref:hypothetical protein n=1 Tax=Bacillus sp. JJ722 TaxID=3122973 RepID=UPI002FFEC27D